MHEHRERPTLPDGIKAQHTHLAALVREVREAHDRGVAWAELAVMLDELLDHVRGHFEHEEEEMEKAGYPELAEHRGYHQAFLRRIEVLRAECDRRETELMSVVAELLENWFRNHERTADRHVMQFLKLDGP